MDKHHVGLLLDAISPRPTFATALAALLKRRPSYAGFEKSAFLTLGSDLKLNYSFVTFLPRERASVANLMFDVSI